LQATNPFAQMPTTPEPIIAQVRRQLADDDRVGARVPTGVLDRVADQTVRELWGSRVKTFVPVLALRQAREVLQEQDWLVTTEHWVMGPSQASPTMAPGDERPRHDVLALQDDVLPQDDQDALPV
jgi:hypothetical protein